jgi:hypothetical protein
MANDKASAEKYLKGESVKYGTTEPNKKNTKKRKANTSMKKTVKKQKYFNDGIPQAKSLYDNVEELGKITC